MNNKKKLLKKLRKEIITLEKHIENREVYNLKSSIMGAVIDAGIAIEYVLPYIFSALIMFQVNISDGNNPLKKDLVYDKLTVETVKTSNGLELDKIFDEYDESLNKDLLEYSTSWIINEYGLYERNITSYQVDDINLNDSFLLLNKEELDKNYNVIDIKKIYKDKLNDEDKIYNQDLVIIKSIKEELDLNNPRYENIFEMTGEFLLYLISTILSGKIIKIVKKKYIKDRIKDNLTLLKEDYIILDEKDIPNLKRIIEIKNNNLQLFDEESDNNRKLIKKKVDFNVR